MTDGHPASATTLFDVAVVGAGVNGAAICHALTRAGYRVLLLDRSDIGSGTSQASTMLVWGGLLYLRRLEVGTVVALSRDRDRLIAERPDMVRPQSILYVPANDERRLLVSGALSAYWALSAGRRLRPRRLTRFPEQDWLADGRAAYEFEEATLVESDARFVLAWALDAERLGAHLFTYARVDTATAHGDGTWRLGLCDTLTGATSEVVARLVVNAAGAWADDLNARARVTSPWRHAFSRGVSIALPRDPRHTRHVVVDSRLGDALTLAPWGPVSLWASTDALEPNLAEAGRIQPDDVPILLDEYHRHFLHRYSIDDIVSVRVGVRALPVARGRAVAADSRSVTRHHRVHLDDARNWISVYGGKLSGCQGLADDVTTLVVRRLPRPLTVTGTQPDLAPVPVPELTRFPGLDTPVVSAAWSAAHEHCHRLDDYLRRRTNIAQWVPNGGFGRQFEHAGHLERIALDIHDGDTGLAERELVAYSRQLHDQPPRPDRAVSTSPTVVDDGPPPGFVVPEIPPAAAQPVRRRRSATARWRHES